METKVIGINIVGYNDKETAIIQYNNEKKLIKLRSLKRLISDGKVRVLNTAVVKCIGKNRDKHGRITEYAIQYKNGVVKRVAPYWLKDAIYNLSISCLNLTLTSDNRLIDKAEEKPAASSKLPEIRSTTELKPNPQGNAVKPTETNYYILSNSDLVRLFDAIYAQIPNRKGAHLEVMIAGDKLDRSKLGEEAQMINVKDTPFSFIHGFKNNKHRFLVVCTDVNGVLKMPADSKKLFEVPHLIGSGEYDVCTGNVFIDADIDLNTTTEGTVIDALILNGLDWSDVKSAEMTFNKFYWVVKVKIENSEAPKLRNLFGFFQGSISLRAVDLKTFRVPNVDRSTNMFYRCINIKEPSQLELSGISLSNARYVGRMLSCFDHPYNKSSTKAIKLGERLGWHGYFDGRANDIGSDRLSYAKQHYPGEEEYYANKRKAEKEKALAKKDLDKEFKRFGYVHDSVIEAVIKYYL